MKRKNNFYYDNLTYSNLLKIYKEVRTTCKSETKLFYFTQNLHTNIYEILKKMYDQKYNFKNYHIFLICEPKYRIIMSEDIDDKIVNHFVALNYLLPVLDKTLINANVATRKNKGAKLAYQLFEKYLNSIGINNKIYVLKMDISKYFYSINHEILMQKLEKKIKDKNVLTIVKQIISSTNKEYVNMTIKRLKENELRKIQISKMNDRDKELRKKAIESIPYYEKGKGLSIGNVCSQILAVFYLNDVDRYIKEELKCKYYVRYMDDLVILSTDYERLKIIFSKITEKIEEHKIKVNPKSKIHIFNNGFTFLGYTYRIVNGKIIKRSKNDTRKRIKRKLKFLKLNDYQKYFLSIISYKGFFGKKFIKLNKEYNFIKNKYADYLVFYYKNYKYIYGDKEDIIVKKVINNKKLNSENFYLIKRYLKGKNIPYIKLKENKFEINN